MSCCAKCGYPICTGFCSQACMDQQEITRLRALLRKCEREVKRLCLSEEATDTEGNETWERARALHAKLKTELEAAG